VCNSLLARVGTLCLYWRSIVTCGDRLSLHRVVWFLGINVAEGHAALCRELKFILCLCKLSFEMLMFCRKKAVSVLDMPPYPHVVHCVMVRQELYYERRSQNKFTVPVSVPRTRIIIRVIIILIIIISFKPLSDRDRWRVLVNAVMNLRVS
jgi:hypothetical protein